jgi:hypothetical protein
LIATRILCQIGLWGDAAEGLFGQNVVDDSQHDREAEVKRPDGEGAEGCQGIADNVEAFVGGNLVVIA